MPPSASSAIVKPPEAEPVNDASTLVATASDTSTPPSMPSTQSRTSANAGSAATTEPNPTRLATLTTGRTEALAPASMLSRSAGRRRKLIAIRTTMAAARAVTTAHTPPTAASEVAPHSG